MGVRLEWLNDGIGILDEKMCMGGENKFRRDLTKRGVKLDEGVHNHYS